MQPAIDGLSYRTRYEVHRLESTRNYLNAGDVGLAVHLWKVHMCRPERQLWEAAEADDPHGYCCGDPYAGRALLDAVVRALSRRGARELREVIDWLDGL
ncbi:hypothetical protein K7862_09415 [Streptomyces sp. PLK6-54]|uniref:Uncharacterized protein n=1 Tax=Actinacidiphila acidipaludis TaxID=2873382 RepID=A0ABS7Q4S8_9ACTN|nr:hypothetical protein [Streptomyces acidipaludis]